MIDIALVTTLISFLRDVGFPIGVAAFVLWRIEPAIKANTAAVVDLRVVVARGLHVVDAAGDVAKGSH